MRNLQPTRLEPGQRFNVLFGDNGQGKTNLLEAIYVAFGLRSFRTNRLADVIATGQEQANIIATVASPGVTHHCEVTLRPTRREVLLNGKTPRPIRTYLGNFHTVLFAPEDLQIPKASPSDRRRFLDRCVFHYFPAYWESSRNYDKVVKSRNALLRDMADRHQKEHPLLEVYDEQLADFGTQVRGHRRKYVSQLQHRLQHAFHSIVRSETPVEIRYHIGANRDESQSDPSLLTREQILASRRVDLARCITSVGPHRDDLAFIFDGHPVEIYASQGQIRAIMLAWKTAEMSLLAEVHQDPPILLLDDVSSELDATRNQYLFEFLRAQNNQCFITTTHPNYVKLDRDRCDYEICSGSVNRR